MSDLINEITAMIGEVDVARAREREALRDLNTSEVRHTITHLSMVSDMPLRQVTNRAVLMADNAARAARDHHIEMLRTLDVMTAESIVAADPSDAAATLVAIYIVNRVDAAQSSTRILRLRRAIRDMYFGLDSGSWSGIDHVARLVAESSDPIAIDACMDFLTRELSTRRTDQP